MSYPFLQEEVSVVLDDQEVVARGDGVNGAFPVNGVADARRVPPVGYQVQGLLENIKYNVSKLS